MNLRSTWPPADGCELPVPRRRYPATAPDVNTKTNRCTRLMRARRSIIGCRVFTALAHLMYRRRVVVVALFAALFPLAGLAGSPVMKLLKAGGFEDPGAEGWQVKDKLEHELEVGPADVIALYTAPT